MCQKPTSTSSSTNDERIEESISKLVQQNGNDGDRDSDLSSLVRPTTRKLMFPRQLHDLLRECDDEIATWNRNGSSFMIVDHVAFVQEVLPKYFRHTNLDSFKRQLNAYGFQGRFPMYRHPFFQRDNRGCLSKVQRTGGSGKQSQERQNASKKKIIARKSPVSRKRIEERPSSSAKSVHVESLCHSIPYPHITGTSILEAKYGASMLKNKTWRSNQYLLTPSDLFSGIDTLGIDSYSGSYSNTRNEDYIIETSGIADGDHVLDALAAELATPANSLSAIEIDDAMEQWDTLCENFEI